MSHMNRSERPGIILLVVMVMLALFAVVAVSFVFYAESQATANKFVRESQGQFQPDCEPEFLLNFFLAGLNYGAHDTNGVSSAIRGHDLATTLYGGDPNRTNFIPYAGPGVPATFNDPNLGVPALFLPNYTYFAIDGFVRDRERLGNRLNPTAPMNATYVGANVPYTAADLRNMFLAAVNAKGEVLLPSFYRPWAGPAASPLGPLDPANPNWSTSPPAANIPWLKYASLRPMPYLHPNFPPPEDGGGDVKNLDWSPGTPKPGGGYYNNDSIWMDLGFPVQTAPDGRKYKPLFAPLIIDLDGKINVNAAGNLRGDQNSPTPYHASNQGFGVWEVNIGHALTQGDWVNVLKGNSAANLPGRYGNNGFPNWPGNVPPLGSGAGPAFYGFADLDGVQAMLPTPTYLPSKKIYYPGETGNANPTFFGWPNYDLASYGNGDALEHKDHPRLFNPMFPADRKWNVGDTLEPTGQPSDDRLFSAYHLEALYRYGGTGSPALRSDLFRLAPQNFSGLGNEPLRRRNLITTHSSDLGRPGLVPWLSNGLPLPYTYTLALGDLYPKGGAFAVDPASIPATGEFPSGAFSPQYRGMTIADDPNFVQTVKRLNMQVPLTAYPNIDAATGRITDLAAYATALKERQVFARDIYNLLRFVTMGDRPPAGAATIPPDPAMVTDAPTDADQYKAARYLAQLAVNIVDYRDQDNYITPFNWNPAQSADEKKGWVFGTEMPRLVLNELYTELQNDSRGATAPDAEYFKVNFWVELLNPFKADPNLAEPITGKPSAVRLFNTQDMANKCAPYKLLVYKGTDINLRAPDNVRGEPDRTDPTKILIEITDFTPDGMPTVDTQIVEAIDQNYSGPSGDNKGFYLLGPDTLYTLPGTAPTVTPTLQLKDIPPVMGSPNNSMHYNLDKSTDLTMLPTHTVLLQRLACPYLLHQPDPAVAAYNPYITVDYVEQIPSADGATLDAAGLARTPPLPVEERKSKGRKQPYAAHSSQIVDQEPNPAPAVGVEPKHTFFRHNSTTAAPPAIPGDATLTLPFDWLVHLDRNLVSPAELLHVSGFRPHELTQQFMTGSTSALRFTHQAPWLKADARIYRLLEHLDGGWRAQGVSLEGRYPGKINVNMIWDLEVFRALCDAQLASNFTSNNNGDVEKAFDALMKSRHPDQAAANFYPLHTTAPLGGQLYVPTGKDRPFLSYNAAFTSDGSATPETGLEDTLLRKHPTDPTRRLFEPDLSSMSPASLKDQPYLKSEILRKIFNSTTTRSNAFAVWVTVGFFEVTETMVGVNPVYSLGKEIGKAEGRHIRHRMFAIIDRTQMSLFESKLTPPITAGSDQPVTAGVLAAGQTVRVKSDQNSTGEDVSIVAVDYAKGTFTATFTQNHRTNVTIQQGPNFLTTLKPTLAIQPGPQVVMAGVIQKGMLLTVSSDQGLEDVLVTDVTSGVFRANFLRSHTTNIVISARGNPGPIPGYSARKDTGVVPYFSVIK